MEWTARAFEVRPSLWALVTEYAPEEEQIEIKQVLGEDLVDETVDLHAEVRTLLEIWTDYREDTEEIQRESNLRQHRRRLPEAPLVRENLEREIKLFVDCLRKRNSDSERILKSVLTRKDSDVLEHVLEKAEKQRPESSLSKRPNTSSSRPQTAVTRDGRETPLRATPSSDGSRCASSLSDTLDCMQDRLNALDIDNISQHLREFLENEKEGLLEDIQFLQDCLDEESEYRQQLSTSPPAEPSVKELRDVGTKLEKELLTQPPLPDDPTASSKIGSSSRHLPTERNRLVKSTSLDPIPQGEASPSLVPKPPMSPPDKSSYTRLHGRCVTAVTIRRIVPSPPSSAVPPLPRNPSPPTSAKLARPTSANKFRKMVIDCRETGK